MFSRSFMIKGYLAAKSMFQNEVPKRWYREPVILLFCSPKGERSLASKYLLLIREQGTQAPTFYVVCEEGEEKRGAHGLRYCCRNLLTFGLHTHCRVSVASVQEFSAKPWSCFPRESWVCFQMWPQLGSTSEPSITAHRFPKQLVWKKFPLFCMSKCWLVYFMIDLSRWMGLFLRISCTPTLCA